MRTSARTPALRPAALLGALLLAALLPDPTARAADLATQADEPSIPADRAVALAVNHLAPMAGGFRLQHPRYRALFAATGVSLAPRSGDVAWRWRLDAVATAGRPAPDVRRVAAPPRRRDALTLSYDRGGLVEEYVLGRSAIEQRFVLPRPLAVSGDLDLLGRIESAGRFVPLADGWSWRQARGGVRLGQVRVVDAGGRELPAEMTVTATTTHIHVPGEALANAVYPVVVDPEVGPDDFRISDMGGTGNTTYNAIDSAVAYNSTDHEYLVAWRGDDNANGSIDNDYAIFAQRIDATTGAEVGANDFRISGGANASGDCSHPAIAYDPNDNQYLVVWQAQGLSAAFGPFEYEIFGQLLAADGTQIGTNDLRLSDMGGTGSSTYNGLVPDVAFSTPHGEYLVVWSGDDPDGGTINDQFEIFAQRVSAAGAEVGSNDFRISDMGPTGSTASDANRPAIAYNAVDDEYLVVWDGDDFGGTTADNELEIFGQRLLAATGAETGPDDFRISTQGPAGNLSYKAFEPTVAHDPDDDQYLVVWTGDAVVGSFDSSLQIFGQRLDAAGAEIGTNDAMLSNVGGGNDPGFDADYAEVAYSHATREYLVSFTASDNRDGMVGGETEAFVQRVDGATGAQLGGDDERISHMGPDGVAGWVAVASAVACGPSSGECLVVWKGDDDAGGLVLNEIEIFGQRYVASVGLFADGFESGQLDAWSGVAP